MRWQNVHVCFLLLFCGESEKPQQRSQHEEYERIATAQGYNDKIIQTVQEGNLAEIKEYAVLTAVTEEPSNPADQIWKHENKTS